MTPKEMALAIAKAVDSKKGKDILVLETDGVTSLCDYFVLCSGTSAPQLKALGDAAEKAMKDNDILPHHIEGHRGGTWILQDYGDVVVHQGGSERDPRSRKRLSINNILGKRDNIEVRV